MNLAEATTKYITGEFKLKGEFSGEDTFRESVMTRCERYAGWTLPMVFPDESVNEDDEMQNDYQSVGAMATTNLANKIMMALFQPSKPFFRSNLTQEQRNAVEANGMASAKIDEVLAETERDAMRELDKINARVALNNAVLLLIITGNAMVHMPADDDLQVFSLRDYSMVRDLRGKMVKSIMRETISVLALSEEFAELVMAEGYNEKDEISIYTCIQRVSKDKFIVWQELEDICYCHKTIGYYSQDGLPWIPLVWNLVRGKDYGTGLVENYAGDFHTMSTLSEAMLDYTTIATDVKNLVNPTGMTDVRELTEAASGAYVHGREEDIFTHTANVSNVTDFLNNRFETVSRRIGAAFLLNNMVTRNAERVTAEEIRMQAHELESSLGGVYSRLARELQLPLAIRLLSKMNPAFREVEPIIVTGFDSLSRNSDLGNIRAFLQDVIVLSDVPEDVNDLLNKPNLLSVLGSGHGVDYKKFLNDEATVAKIKEDRNRQQAQAAGMEAQAVNSQTQGQPT